MTPPENSPPDELDRLLDRNRIIAGRAAPARRRRTLLFLVESWADAESGDVLEFLESTEIFGSLERSALRGLLPHLEPVHVAAGATVLGDPNDSLFLVGHGRLEFGTGAAVAGEAGPGQVVGAGALLQRAEPGSWARAVRDSLLLRLPADSFAVFAKRHPEALLGFCRALVGLLTTTREPGVEAARSVSTVAVVPAGARPVPAGFVRELAASLRRQGPTLELCARSVDADRGPGASGIELDDPRNGGLVGWLHRAEQQHRFVLYEADSDDTNWTRRCLRQADRVLVVGEASADPRLGAAERSLVVPQRGAAGPRCDLILLHPAGSGVPRGTARWLAGRPVTAVHHVRTGRTADFRRVARHLSGQACGLVLGGGGMRGFAHLGVMRALEEAGIEVDVVGGTSIGAIMGAFFAAELDDGARVRAATRAMIEQGSVVGCTLPLVSVSSARKVSRLLRAEPAFAPGIEDLWRPFFCVSASLNAVQEVIHERGLVWRAIRSSISLPGVYPPVHRSGDLLVDGGVLNNLPVDVMATRVSAGPIIAVDLQPAAHGAPPEPFDVSLSGWKVLASRLNPFTRTIQMPGLADVVLRSLLLASTKAQCERLVHRPVALYLRPPLGAASLLDFASGPALIEPAYRHTLAALQSTPFPVQQ